MAKTTFVVAFGEGSGSSDSVVVELEPSLNVDADGNEKSTFSPGDEVYFTVHYPPSLRVGGFTTTSGDVHHIGIGEFDRSQSGVFFPTTEDAVTLQHTPSSALEFFWFGRIGILDIDGKAVKVTNAPCIGDLRYKIHADLFRYIPPSEMTMNSDGQYVSGVVILMESA